MGCSLGPEKNPEKKYTELIQQVLTANSHITVSEIKVNQVNQKLCQKINSNLKIPLRKLGTYLQINRSKIPHTSYHLKQFYEQQKSLLRVLICLAIIKLLIKVVGNTRKQLQNIYIFQKWLVDILIELMNYSKDCRWIQLSIIQKIKLYIDLQLPLSQESLLTYLSVFTEFYNQEGIIPLLYLLISLIQPPFSVTLQHFRKCLNLIKTDQRFKPLVQKFIQKYKQAQYWQWISIFVQFQDKEWGRFLVEWGGRNIEIKVINAILDKLSNINDFNSLENNSQIKNYQHQITQEDQKKQGFSLQKQQFIYFKMNNHLIQYILVLLPQLQIQTFLLYNFKKAVKVCLNNLGSKLPFKNLIYRILQKEISSFRKQFIYNQVIERLQRNRNAIEQLLQLLQFLINLGVQQHLYEQLFRLSHLLPRIQYTIILQITIPKINNPEYIIPQLMKPRQTQLPLAKQYQGYVSYTNILKILIKKGFFQYMLVQKGQGWRAFLVYGQLWKAVDIIYCKNIYNQYFSKGYLSKIHQYFALTNNKSQKKPMFLEVAAPSLHQINERLIRLPLVNIEKIQKYIKMKQQKQKQMSIEQSKQEERKGFFRRNSLVSGQQSFNEQVNCILQYLKN